jgi:hypothetical protein
MDADLQAVQELVNTATLPDEARHTANWCLDQLPELYDKFSQTYDARYPEAIRRLVRAMLGALTPRRKATTEARQLAEAVLDRLGALHERLGLPELDIKASRPRKVA